MDHYKEQTDSDELTSSENDGDSSESEWIDEQNRAQDDDMDRMDNNSDDHYAEWCTPTSGYIYPEFIQYSGPSRAAKKCKTALEFFELFLSRGLMKNLVDGTNAYANAKIELSKKQKLQQSNSQPSTRANTKQKQEIEAKHEHSINWYDTNHQEMKAFIGINLYMGILKLPSASDYFRNLYKQSIVVRTFTRDRFQQVQSNWHCDNTVNDTDNDVLFKIRPLIMGIIHNFQLHFTPTQHLTVDESMVGFSGRVKFKQHVKRKPVKSGYKIWVLADSTHRYMLNFQIYTGKSINACNNSEEKAQINNSLAYNVVTSLIQSYTNQNHIVYTDSFYTSIQLSQDLLKLGVYSCGTILPNRKHFPGQKLIQDLARPIQWGVHKSLHHSADKQLTATVWKDKNLVYLLSTCHDPNKITAVHRRARREKQQLNISAPEVVYEYQKHMRGVDVIDQLHSYYAPRRKSRKWWTCLVWWMINICVLNAYSIAQQVFPNKYKGQRQFREQLIQELIGNFSNRDKPPHLTSPYLSFYTNKGLLNAAHWVAKIDNTNRRSCQYCRTRAKNVSNNDNNQLKKRTPRSSYKCEHCNVVLCLFPCFKQYHVQMALQMKQQQQQQQPNNDAIQVDELELSRNHLF